MLPEDSENRKCHYLPQRIETAEIPSWASQRTADCQWSPFPTLEGCSWQLLLLSIQRQVGVHQAGKGSQPKPRGTISPECQALLNYHEEPAWDSLDSSSAWNKTTAKTNQLVKAYG